MVNNDDDGNEDDNDINDDNHDIDNDDNYNDNDKTTIMTIIKISITNDNPTIITNGKGDSSSTYHILRTIRHTFFFEKLSPKFRCILYSKLI